MCFSKKDSHEDIEINGLRVGCSHGSANRSFENDRTEAGTKLPIGGCFQSNRKKPTIVTESTIQAAVLVNLFNRLRRISIKTCRKLAKSW